MPSHDSHPTTACNEFIENHLGRIRGLCRRILRTKGCFDADGHVEEVVDEVVVNVVRSWDSLRSPDGALSSISANAARTHARKCRRERPQEIYENDIPLFALGALDPTAIYEHLILLGEYLDQLSPDDQSLIRLIEEGRDYKEIAALTGQPGGTLRSRYHRAMKKLKQIKERMDGGFAPPHAAADTD